jgi:hypothetical protein
LAVGNSPDRVKSKDEDMGTGVRSQIVVGVHLSPVTEQVSKTKYDEDTGEPYEGKEQRTFFVIERTDIKVDPEDIGDWMEIAHGHYEDRHSYFLGKIAIETGSVKSTNSLWEKCPSLGPIQLQVTSFLREKFEYAGDVDVFVLTFIS